MNLKEEKQEEELMVSSEGESTGARRTRPMERAKEKEEEGANMKAKEEDSAAKENSRRGR